MAKHGIHKYKGEDFPEFVGEEIEVRDCKDSEFPSYTIRFIGELMWHDGMDDDDIDWVGN